MKLSDIPLNPSSRMLRQFAGGWIVLFVILAVDQWLRKHNPEQALYFAAVSTVGVIGLAVPCAIRWLYLVMTLITFPIGVMVSKLILILMYYLVITPIGLVMRLIGRDALVLKRPASQTSFWHDCSQKREPTRYLKQY